jgi:nascent polypeptide-associated complex subunit beta
VPILTSHLFCKALQELLPEIIHQIGPDAIPNLKKLAENVQNASRAAAAAADNDDEIPPLVDAVEEPKTN